MRVIATIEESHAHGATKDIYTNIERTLAVPFVGMVFRSLATREGVLEAVWPQIRRNIETQAFSDLAGQLRRNSEGAVETTLEFDDVFAWLGEHNFSREDVRHIRYALEMLHFVNSKLLLANAAMYVSLHNISNPKIVRSRPKEITKTEPQFPTRVSRVMLEQAPADTKEIFLDVMDAVRVPAIPDDFLMLAEWPTFLRRIWNDLRPAMHSPTFIDEAATLSALAIESAQELPYPISLENAGIDTRRIVDMFQSFYPMVSLATAAVRWMVIEGERVNRSIGRAAGEAGFGQG